MTGNFVLEVSRALQKQNQERAEKNERALNEKVNAREKFTKEYYNTLNSRTNKERKHGMLLEAARNNALSTAVKAIYITALEAGTLTDDAIILAENMVDNWIKESGGARIIFNKCPDTYFLYRLRQIVEDAAEEDVKDIEKEEDSAEEEDSKDEKETKEEKSSEDDDSDDKEEDDKDESEDDSDEDDDEEKPEDKSAEILSDDELDSDGDGESDEVEDAAEEVDDIADDPEVPVDDVTIDGDNENKGKVFEELEKEEDVKKAIELIRTRIADAEETFIKRNTEDKKQIDELLSKISDNIKTVEDMDDDNSAESKIAKESVNMYKRKINNITDNRRVSIYEKVARCVTESMNKDNVLREQFTDKES